MWDAQICCGQKLGWNPFERRFRAWRSKLSEKERMGASLSNQRKHAAGNSVHQIYEFLFSACWKKAIQCILDMQLPNQGRKQIYLRLLVVSNHCHLFLYLLSPHKPMTLLKELYFMLSSFSTDRPCALSAAGRGCWKTLLVIVIKTTKLRGYPSEIISLFNEQSVPTCLVQ